MKYEVPDNSKGENGSPSGEMGVTASLQFKYFERLEEGNVLENYFHLIGQQGSMLILNVNSDEALSKIIGQDPMFFNLIREIYPLTTRKTHEKQIRPLLKKGE